MSIYQTSRIKQTETDFSILITIRFSKRVTIRISTAKHKNRYAFVFSETTIFNIIISIIMIIFARCNLLCHCKALVNQHGLYIFLHCINSSYTF